MAGAITQHFDARLVEENGAPGSTFTRTQLKPISGAAFATAEALRERSLKHARSCPSFAASQIADRHGSPRRHGRTRHSATIVAGALGHTDSDVSQRLGVSRFRSRPPNDGQRAAGLPTGAPLHRDYATKFDMMDAQERRDDFVPYLPTYDLERTRWRTMKYDSSKSAHSGTKRPPAPPDHTGFSNVYHG